MNLTFPSKVHRGIVMVCHGFSMGIFPSWFSKVHIVSASAFSPKIQGIHGEQFAIFVSEKIKIESEFGHVIMFP